MFDDQEERVEFIPKNNRRKAGFIFWLFQSVSLLLIVQSFLLWWFNQSNLKISIYFTIFFSYFWFGLIARFFLLVCSYFLSTYVLTLEMYLQISTWAFVQSSLLSQYKLLHLFLVSVALLSVCLGIEALLVRIISVMFKKRAIEPKLKRSEYEQYVIKMILKTSITIDARLDSELEHLMPYSLFKLQKNLPPLYGEGTKIALKKAETLFEILSKNTNMVLTAENFIFLGEFYAEAFDIFDENFDGQITRQEFLIAVDGIYKKRRDLIKNISSTSSAIQTLDYALKPFAVLLILLLGKVPIPIQSIFAVLVGVYLFTQDAVKNFIYSVIFVFIVHAFDVGDLIVINNSEYQVTDISLSISTLKNSLGLETYIHNYTLYSETISNITRSNEIWAETSLSLNVHTSPLLQSKLYSEVKKFLETNKRFYHPEFHFIPEKSKITELLFTVKVKLYNFNDSKIRWRSQLLLIQRIQTILQDLKIESN